MVQIRMLHRTKTSIFMASCGKQLVHTCSDNSIEHAWTTFLRRLICVILNACDENEDIPPCRNAELTDEELQEKQQRILNNAAEEVCKYWTGADFDGFPVIPIAVPSEGRDDPFESADDIISFLEAPYTNIKKGEHKKALDEFKFFAKHVDRRHNEIIFAKCPFFSDS